MFAELPGRIFTVEVKCRTQELNFCIGKSSHGENSCIEGALRNAIVFKENTESCKG